MFSRFIVLLSFSKSLAREAKVSDWKKCLFLSDERCMVRSTTIGMNPVEPKYYPLMFSLNKCTGNSNPLSPKICVPKETKTWMLKHLIW